MRWINAEKVIHTQIYDDEYEECSEREMTIEELLDAFTDEGCPTVVVHPEQQWIPCSERLPDKPDVYLISSEGISVTVAFFADGKWTTPTYLPLIGVDAWMPLPEPWEGEEHDS